MPKLTSSLYCKDAHELYLTVGTSPNRGEKRVCDFCDNDFTTDDESLYYNCKFGCEWDACFDCGSKWL